MIDGLVAATIRLVCGARANWLGRSPQTAPAIYFANHTSNLDFPVIWSELAPPVRKQTRPVAAADYWGKGRIRRFLALKVFHALLVDRGHVTRETNPVGPIAEAVGMGHSLIIFPEGNRSADGAIGPFKSGLFYLRRAMPEVDFVPVYLDNLMRILPKGEFIGVPMLSSVTFGPPLDVVEGEPRGLFLERARRALEALRPK